MTLEELQAKREQILAEMTGPQSLHFGDRGKTSRPLSELENALRLIDAEINKQSGYAPRSRITRITTDKGF